MTRRSHVWKTYANLRARTWATEPHRNYQLPSPAERNKLANDFFLRLWPDWQARVSFFPCWARWSRAEAAAGRETSLRCVWASDRVTGIRHSDPAQKMINLKKMSSGGSMTIFLVEEAKNIVCLGHTESQARHTLCGRLVLDLELA